MAKKLDPQLIEVLTKYGEDVKEALWDCHGVWVAYHKAIERIAAKAGVVFDMPQVIEANTAAKTATIAVRGTMGERTEWSFGEASPANNKNAYPFAMAEKRAKDRVVLKLVGLHGHVYSEEESDDFKPNASATPNTVTGPRIAVSNEKPASAAAMKRNSEWEQFMNDLYQCTTVGQINGLYKAIAAPGRKLVWSQYWLELAVDECAKYKADLLAKQEAELEADTFPGDLPANSNFVSTLQAGE